MSMLSIKTMGFVLLNKKGNPLKNMPGHIFMVDNLQDCNMLIPLMDLFLPVRLTISSPVLSSCSATTMISKHQDLRRRKSQMCPSNQGSYHSSVPSAKQEREPDSASQKSSLRQGPQHGVFVWTVERSSKRLLLRDHLAEEHSMIFKTEINHHENEQGFGAKFLPATSFRNKKFLVKMSQIL